MKNRFLYRTFSLLTLELFILTASCFAQSKTDRRSEDPLNTITLSLNGEGKLSYN
ncbi:hypothetical protein [Mucilaginibacter aquariorum]|uniref:Uncharacterized protein n=1 Tax=Mucilaginibacter aquariorum TaxID=2967225 RepID=A0ABT1SXX3_9SPHI|nr:hypothetical protein [Mucilaginibacter aquariorum]MCQ6957199.1 hypothetical protein [Mucilaginibacter aquariorum]